MVLIIFTRKLVKVSTLNKFEIVTSMDFKVDYKLEGE